ncbi:MAG: hypothetical protein JWN61_2893 [Pseudonocardiales bacterium]|nr:hypothetical protein [Pseudonocardiales bacterium]
MTTASISSARASVARRLALALPSPTSTPFATAMTLLLAGAALMLQLHPGAVAAVTAWTSTNVDNLADHPVAAMIGSAFVLPGSPLNELVLVAIGLTVLERAVGAKRTLIIALAGHVIATLLTEYGAQLAAQMHLIASAPTDRDDAGVSYVMYAALAAAAMTMAGRSRLAGLLVLAVLVGVPFASSPDMTTTGHLLCVGIGAGAMRIGVLAAGRDVPLFAFAAGWNLRVRVPRIGSLLRS